jgi:putative PIN family toxin of toxin-antitoxin system
VLRNGILLASPQSLTELAEVLGRAKFNRYLTWEEREDFFAALAARAEMTLPQVEFSACCDPDDNRMLELAVAGGASAIIAGDADLLDLSPFQGIPILTPRAFADRFPL